jgi:hypothetical protein
MLRQSRSSAVVAGGSPPLDDTDEGTSPGIVAYRLGGRDYPLRRATGCHTCSSSYRASVERGIAHGVSFAAIARALPEDAALEAHNIAAHYRNGHVPLEIEAVRRLIEERAAEAGADLEEGVASILDHVSLARLVVAQVAAQVADGTMPLSVGDGIAAGRLLATVEREMTEQGDMALLTRAFIVLQDTARDVMSPEQFAEFGRRLMDNEELRGLRERGARRELAGSGQGG